MENHFAEQGKNHSDCEETYFTPLIASHMRSNKIGESAHSNYEYFSVGSEAA